MANNEKPGQLLAYESRAQLKELLIQIHLMKSYLTQQGMSVPPNTAAQLAALCELTDFQSAGANAEKVMSEGSADDLRWMEAPNISKALQLAFEIHGKLGDLVKPATPESIRASEPRKGWDRLRSPTVTDLLMAITFIGIALFVWGTWAARGNVQAWQSQLIYLGAALLGASFSGLYTAYKYVSTRTFDPLASSSYLTRVVLGAVSGLILANFGESFTGGKSATVKVVAPAAMGLIGGYSADAVNLILQRVADTLVAAVRGSGDESVKAKQATIQADSKAAEVQQRQATASELGQLLSITNDPEAMKAAIQRLMAAIGKGEEVSGTVTKNKPEPGPSSV